MKQICLALPVQPGQRDDARAFMLELEQSRKEQYSGSEERSGSRKKFGSSPPLNRRASWSDTSKPGTSCVVRVLDIPRRLRPGVQGSPRASHWHRPERSAKNLARTPVQLFARGMPLASDAH
jgi:hypothetical protein